MTEPHTPSNTIQQIVRQHKAGQPVGIFSICSANPFVIKACFKHTRHLPGPLLIESTINQVNQFGGYMGMNPSTFIAYLKDLAKRDQFPENKLLIGGDHLGPTIWADEAAESAMQKACQLVNDYVLAGYTKIHLDASQRCADDPSGPLDPRTSAKRAARMCAVAEAAFAQLPPGSTPPCYVIGTEVPTPGGMTSTSHELEVTRPEDAAETIAITHREFEKLELFSAWDRTVALVVQPGVEFGDATVIEYDRPKARSLSAFIDKEKLLVFEAHSTDYQTSAKLAQMVQDHFAIMKVGPGLTFALREALFALERIEIELNHAKSINLSRLHDTLENAMLTDPQYWLKHYAGGSEDLKIARFYSMSDRIRYYWSKPEVVASVRLLLQNLGLKPIPLSLISAFLPVQYKHIREGALQPAADDLISDKVGEVITDYIYACLPENTTHELNI